MAPGPSAHSRRQGSVRIILTNQNKDLAFKYGLNKAKEGVSCMRRFYLKILAAVFFASGVAFAQPAGQTELEGLIKEALANNPELKAMREQAEAFKQRIPQAKSLDSPQLTLEFSQASLA